MYLLRIDAACSIRGHITSLQTHNECVINVSIVFNYHPPLPPPPKMWSPSTPQKCGVVRPSFRMMTIILSSIVFNHHKSHENVVTKYTPKTWCIARENVVVVNNCLKTCMNSCSWDHYQVNLSKVAKRGGGPTATHVYIHYTYETTPYYL